jgi:hypothetical protein
MPEPPPKANKEPKNPKAKEKAREVKYDEETAITRTIVIRTIAIKPLPTPLISYTAMRMDFNPPPRWPNVS